jgi:hypothetical protein
MLCQKCGQREATETWTNDLMSFVHGMSQEWCNYCCIKEQLDFAREQAMRIPQLEELLKRELLKMEQDEKNS